MKIIAPLTFGVGDRFAHEAAAQLNAFIAARNAGVTILPVWNKSNREHNIIGTQPSETRAAADAAIRELGWSHGYFLDADHINLTNVDRFLAPCDFFTIDVADDIGQPASNADIDAFLTKHPELVGNITIPGIDQPFHLTKDETRRIAAKFLLATQKAGAIYRHILAAKGADFVTEVSMDETDSPQTPAELLVILAALADQAIPIQTIAPKFTGRFNKGVDYVGNVEQFEKEFSDDLAVIAHAITAYSLPATLKLSVHSGSDKFSIYPAIRRCLKASGAGVHVKTAGTNWLEELIGLAEAGGDALTLAKDIYAAALDHKEELCQPYATVIDIDASQLPTASAVNDWTGEQYANALRHIPHHLQYNPHFRQLLHVGFKIAAKKGSRFTDALKEHRAIIAHNVTTNLLERHIRPLFL